MELFQITGFLRTLEQLCIYFIRRDTLICHQNGQVIEQIGNFVNCFSASVWKKQL